jgi:hypothetical protein
VPDPDFGDDPLDARKARLGDVLEDVGLRSIKYLYDFGDGWEHSARIERVTEAEPGAVCPRPIEAAGCCPPEDIGGPWDYNEFLVAITGPNHERHAELVEWSVGLSIRMPSISTDTLAPWKPSAGDGRVHQRSGESDPTDPRYSPYV